MKKQRLVNFLGVGEVEEARCQSDGTLAKNEFASSVKVMISYSGSKLMHITLNISEPTATKPTDNKFKRLVKKYRHGHNFFCI